jgi:hypothetical protein
VRRFDPRARARVIPIGGPEQHRCALISSLSRRPEGLNPLSSATCDVLDRYVMGGWPLLMRTCHARGLDPGALTKPQLETIMSTMADVVARMTDDEHATALLSDLAALART